MTSLGEHHPGPRTPAAVPVRPFSPGQQLAATVAKWVQRVTLALAVLGLIGMIIYLWRNGAQPASVEHLKVFHGEPADFRSLRGIFTDRDHFIGRIIGQFAVAMLLLVPVARVAACLPIFRRDGDRLQMIFSVVVLAILVLSLALGR